MKLPLNDKKFLFLLLAITIVVVLEVLSIIGIQIPMPYAPFVFAAFILGIGYNVLWIGVKALFKVQFSNINLLMLISVIGASERAGFEPNSPICSISVIYENSFR